ncbi:MAG: copper resistance CopC family protein, partial [Acidimicrobiales bacterium]
MSAVRRVAVVAALALGVSVASATAASAHAILLRTDPSPQTTVARSPTSIRLEFSEPVEAAFGAVRVFDVDGRRVDPARVTLSRSGREMVVPVRPLADGTYTVTWRVASADGHPVSGGFGFYVGAPSTISAVAVARDPGPSARVVWGYGAVRFAWLSAFIGLVGMVAARRWVWTPAVRAAGLEESAMASTFRSRFAHALPAAWLVLAVAGLLTLVFQAATVSGLSLAGAARPGVLGQVLETTFGRLWVAQAGLTGLAAVPVVALVRSRPLLGWAPGRWIAVLGLVAFGLALVTALSGHA